MSSTACCPKCGYNPAVEEAVLDETMNRLYYGGKFVQLTDSESVTVRALLSRPSGITQDGIYIQLYGARPYADQPEPHIISVMLCKIRHKLRSAQIPLKLAHRYNGIYRLERADGLRV